LNKIDEKIEFKLVQKWVFDETLMKIRKLLLNMRHNRNIIKFEIKDWLA